MKFMLTVIMILTMTQAAPILRTSETGNGQAPVRVRFADPEIDAIAHGRVFPGAGFTPEIAKALQAVVVWMETATTVKDIEVLPHVQNSGPAKDAVLRLSGDVGLGYGIEGEIVTVIGVLAMVRHA